MIITIRETRSLFCSVRDRIKKKKKKKRTTRLRTFHDTEIHDIPRCDKVGDSRRPLSRLTLLSLVTYRHRMKRDSPMKMLEER